MIGVAVDTYTNIEETIKDMDHYKAEYFKEQLTNYLITARALNSVGDKNSENNTEAFMAWYKLLLEVKEKK